MHRVVHTRRRLVTSLGMLALLVAQLALAAPVAAGAATCPGLADDPRTQIVVTDGPDMLIGTAGDDIICGRGGDDTIIGQGGFDILRGGDGSDVIRGGDGKDVLYGGRGADILRGGAKADILLGGARAGHPARRAGGRQPHRRRGPRPPQRGTLDGQVPRRGRGGYEGEMRVLAVRGGVRARRCLIGRGYLLSSPVMSLARESVVVGRSRDLPSRTSASLAAASQSILDGFKSRASYADSN